MRVGWEGSKAQAPRPQHAQQQQQHNSATAASQRCLAAVTRCLWHCEHFLQGLLGAPHGQLGKNAALPALAEVLRAWSRTDDKAPSRSSQEHLAGAVMALHDALATIFPSLFKQGGVLLLCMALNSASPPFPVLS